MPSVTDNCSVLYQRVPKLFADLALARGDGRYARILRGLAGVQLLILDDWGLEPLDAGARHNLYEILEECYGRRSTILTSQIPVDCRDRRPNLCQRHPRPSRPQRPPHRSHLRWSLVCRRGFCGAWVCSEAAERQARYRLPGQRHGR